MIIDLRDSIEDHCNQCEFLETIACKNCFFSSLDFRRMNLGSNSVYRRAYHLLKVLRITGYKRADTFGERLNIPVRK
jgi:hypothetical protein